MMPVIDSCDRMFMHVVDATGTTGWRTQKKTTSASSVKTGAMLRSWSARKRFRLKPRGAAASAVDMLLNLSCPSMLPPAGRLFRYGPLRIRAPPCPCLMHGHAVGQASGWFPARSTAPGWQRPCRAGDLTMRITSSLAPTSMPRVGSDEDQHLGQVGQPFGQRHLLLVAARQRAQRDAGARRPDLQVLDVRLGDVASPCRASASSRWMRSRMAIETFL